MQNAPLLSLLCILSYYVPHLAEVELDDEPTSLTCIGAPISYLVLGV